MRLTHLGKVLRYPPSVYADPTARINGDVTIAQGASVWCNVFIRGDVHHVRIGESTNVQTTALSTRPMRSTLWKSARAWSSATGPSCTDAPLTGFALVGIVPSSWTAAPSRRR